MRVLGLRTRLFIALGLPLGAGHLSFTSCAPRGPAEDPSGPPLGDASGPPLSSADVGSEAAWSLSIETPSDAGVDASVGVDASPDGDAGESITVVDGGAPDAKTGKRRPRAPSWDASYKLAPGTEKWCKWGNTSCSRAGDVVGVDDQKKFGCPTAIEVPCPCNAGGCIDGLDATCVAPLYGPVTFRERAKVKDACCYDLPRQCVPPWVGRPLVAVSGQPLLPDTLGRSDWCARFESTELGEADAETRAERARVWERIASLEHASVASFAKVSLQLLALGAPAELVMETHAAALDEIEHARLAYAVASASGDRDVGPAPLSVAALALEHPRLADLAGETFRDGCVEETLGVVAAMDLLDRETSPTLRAVLQRIVEDEERHALLAWRTLRWTLESGEGAVRERVQHELARALGQTDPETRRHEVLGELIEPCVRALLARGELSVSPALI